MEYTNFDKQSLVKYTERIAEVIREQYLPVVVKTTAEFQQTPSEISNKNTLYVYSDRSVDSNGVLHPGFKFGDGRAYIVDLPFTSEGSVEEMAAHIRDTSIHTNSEEKAKWNKKISCEVDGETLQFIND